MINAAALDKPACPLPTDGDGVFPNASNALALVVVEDGKARVSGPLAPRVDPAFPLLDAVAASTKFWSVPVLQSWLCRSLGQTSSVLFTDGGVVDTTGIVAHLQKRTPRILAFYHDNNQLDEELSSSTLSSPLAYLFGRAVKTDSMNSKEGPHLAQVFPTALFDSVLRNLTDPSALRARLTNVPVLPNSYLGVPGYRLDELLILGNERSDKFLDKFSPEVAASVSKDFPNSYKGGMKALDANLLCMFTQWRLSAAWADIASIISGSFDSVSLV
jgi:hypothetical protein